MAAALLGTDEALERFNRDHPELAPARSDEPPESQPTGGQGAVPAPAQEDAPPGQGASASRDRRLETIDRALEEFTDGWVRPTKNPMIWQSDRWVSPTPRSAPSQSGSGHAISRRPWPWRPPWPVSSTSDQPTEVPGRDLALPRLVARWAYTVRLEVHADPIESGGLMKRDRGNMRSCFLIRTCDNLVHGWEWWLHGPVQALIATAAIVDDRVCAAPEPTGASMSKSPGKDTSLTLMMRVQQDPADPAAWNEFVRKYQPMIRSWCLKWGAQPSDADDIAQQVLIKLMTAMKSYQHDTSASFRAWLKMVTHNAWIDFVRRPSTRQAPDWLSQIADSDDALADLEQQMEQAFERELLELAMKRVEPRVKPSTWEAFRLTSLEHLSGAEAANRLGTPVSSVFVSKHRVLKLLQEEVRLLMGERG